jgi:hypothetical protein
MNSGTIMELNTGLFYFSSWLPENFSEMGEGAARERSVLRLRRIKILWQKP